MAQYSSAPQLGQYSSLGRAKAFNKLDGATITSRLQRPDEFGPGSANLRQLQASNPDMLPPSMQKARKVGRSMYDPTRLAEQAFRSTRDPMQRLQIGMIRDRMMNPQEDELDQITASYQTGSTQAQQPPSSSTPLGSPQTAGRNAVMGAFSGQGNPAITGFNRSMGRTNFGKGSGVMRPQTQADRVSQTFSIR